MSYTIGIDIGGTFTDCVVVDDGGQVVIGKAFSTPPSFEEGVLDSLTDAAGKLGRTPGELLAVGRVFHGCTVGTNALVEGRTARVGLLVTAGHKEPVFIMTGGDRLSGLPPEVIAALAEHAKPQPLVPRGRVREVHERVTVDGTELVEVDERQVRAAVLELVDEGAEAFAISLLWSIVNEAHEVLVQEIAGRGRRSGMLRVSGIRGRSKDWRV
jgi:N-methylhydantoinase A